jgi:hypothetical protein
MARLFQSLLLLVALPAGSTFGVERSDGVALLGRGIELYREASYASSVALLEQARAAGGLQPAALVECAFYLGAGYLALNSLPAARRELRSVLEHDAEFEPPPYTSPKVMALLSEARHELESAPRLRPLPPERVSERELRLRFEASRTGGVSFGAVRWRWRGDAQFQEAPLGHVGEELVTRIPVERKGTIEYFAEALAPAGSMRVASATAPLELPVALSTPSSRPALGIGRRLWWVWSTVAAVAAGGLATGLYFGLR